MARPASSAMPAAPVTRTPADAGWRRVARGLYGRSDGLAGGRTGLAVRIVTAVILGLIVWQLLAFRSAQPALFPSATSTAHTFWQLLIDGELIRAVAISTLRILAGFALGSIVGTVAGLLMGRYPIVLQVCDPYVSVFRFVPPLAWLGPVILWLGTGEKAKVVLIVYTTVFVVAINACAGVQAIPRNKVRMAQSFGASGQEMFFLITLPGGLPYVFNGMRIAMGNSFMTIVAAEMVAASSGLGYMLNNGLVLFDMRLVFSAIITLGVIGLTVDLLLRYVIRRFGGRYEPIAHRL